MALERSIGAQPRRAGAHLADALSSPELPCGLACSLRFASPARVRSRRRQGDGRGARALGVVLVVDSKGNELVAQNADTALRPGVRHQDRDGLAGAGSARRRLSLRNALLSRRQTGALYQGRRRSLPDLRGTRAARDRARRKIGKAPITGLVVDASYYPSNLRIPGIENDDTAYDALNSALGVNFNTIYAERIGNKVRSAEEQTPITPIAIARFARRALRTERAVSVSARILRSASDTPAS